jgi:hypothetical protein
MGGKKWRTDGTDSTAAVETVSIDVLTIESKNNLNNVD